jgi:hypothetical protein
MEEWRKLCNKEIHDLCVPLSIIIVVKLKVLHLIGHRT